MRILPVLLLAAAACAGPRFSAPSGEGDPGATVVTIQGIAIDSVTLAALPGVKVAIAGKFATTDQAGAFTLPAVAGTVSATASAQGYERFTHDFTIPATQASSTIELPLRRLAPIPLRCELGSAGFTAIVVDLQGRKSLERWTQSSLTLVTPTGSRTISAVRWGYHALDYLKWLVTIPDASPSTIRADWVLFDSQGDAYRGSCEPVAAPPDSTQA